MESVLQGSSQAPESKDSRRNREPLVRHLDSVKENSRHLLSKAEFRFTVDTEEYAIPRFVWLGPAGGGASVRIGIFATLNGDEPEGAFAISTLLSTLERDPHLARGYALYLYPICNPTGYEDQTRTSRKGHALNRLFWTNSDSAEVKFLESEIWMHAFHGIINLRSDAEASGIYGFASGSLLSKLLLEPALDAAEQFLPVNKKARIQGFPARRGIIYSDLYLPSREGVLSGVPGLKHSPFEIALATPRRAPIHLQVDAFCSAIHTILSEFTSVLAFAQDI